MKKRDPKPTQPLSPVDQRELARIAGGLAMGDPVKDWIVASFAM